MAARRGDRHVQEAWHPGQPDALPDLPPLRCGAVPMGGGTPQVPAHPVGHASPATQIKDKNLGGEKEHGKAKTVR